jgi:hypothetical protein
MSCPPWLATINNAPWNTSQPVFMRTVALHRLRTVAGVNDSIGGVGYSGAEQSLSSLEGEIILLTGLPASIQLATAGKTTKNAELPGDATTRPVWNIFIPASAIAIYTIRDRDILLDDEGYRYEVGANYWTAAGYQLSTIRLEA